MPIISMFYGIIIRMFIIDNKHHHLLQRISMGQTRLIFHL